MKKKNVNSLLLKKESISNLNGIFGGKDQITFEYTCNTVVICAPGETQIDCPGPPSPPQPPQIPVTEAYTMCYDVQGTYIYDNCIE
jgi:hypothetical protein